MSVDAGQLASYLTPAVILIGGFRWLVGIIWKRYEATRKEDRDHATARAGELAKALADYQSETAEAQSLAMRVLGEIKEQTTVTNGRVDRLELRAAHIEGVLEERARHDNP